MSKILTFIYYQNVLDIKCIRLTNILIYIGFFYSDVDFDSTVFQGVNISIHFYDLLNITIASLYIT